MHTHDARTAPSGNKGMLIALLVLFGCLFLAWILQLAGVAASQSKCTQVLNNGAFVAGRRSLLESVTPDNLAMVGRKLLTHGRQLLHSNSRICGNQIALTWWTVWFEFLCISLGIALALRHSARNRLGLVVLLFFAIATTILMAAANQLNNLLFANEDVPGDDVGEYVASLRAALAGTVILLVLNFIYLFLCAWNFGSNQPETFALPHAAKGYPPADATATINTTGATTPTAAGVAGTGAGLHHHHAAPMGAGTPTYSPTTAAPPMYSTTPATHTTNTGIVGA